MTTPTFDIGDDVVIGPNDIHPRLRGKAGTVVTITAGDRKYPVAAKQQEGGVPPC